MGGFWKRSNKLGDLIEGHGDRFAPIRRKMFL
jgi:hypothetical protein